jgi:SNF2 family DNA or RNA helicase
MSTWVDEELPKHAPIDYVSLAWDGKDTKKSKSAFDDFMASKKPKVYVVNVEAFQSLNEEIRSRLSRLLRGGKCFMTIDESNFIKGPDAKRAKNAISAGRLCVGRMILTGTEISKSPLDLYMQFEFLKPGFWGVRSFFMFKNKFAILEDAYGAGGRIFKKTVGYQKLNELVASIEPYTTRALKEQCLDLPEKVRVKIIVDMTQAQEKMYNQLKKLLATELESGEIMTVPNKIALFTKFRQLTGGTMKNEDEYMVVEPNPGKLLALIDDLADTDEQAIVWCAFRGEVKLVSDALSKLGEVVTFDGSTDIDDRSEARVRFQKGQARFFVSNMKAGAYGLNLQNCHLQYFYSRDTSPQANWQAEDRSHRPGQRSVCVYKSLLVRNSVDERVLELIEKSEDLRDIVRGMSTEDIVRFV